MLSIMFSNTRRVLVYLSIFICIHIIHLYTLKYISVFLGTFNPCKMNRFWHSLSHEYKSVWMISHASRSWELNKPYFWVLPYFAIKIVWIFFCLLTACEFYSGQKLALMILKLLNQIHDASSHVIRMENKLVIAFD